MDTLLTQEFLISELSAHTSIPIHTLRFYEKTGLFEGKKKPEIKTNNYTYYDESTIEKLTLIQMGKSIGFTLSEIKILLNSWYSNQTSKEEKIAILEEQKILIHQKIEELEKAKEQITAFIETVVSCDK